MSIFEFSKYIYSLLYASVTAASLVLIEKNIEVDAVTSLLICTIISTVFFHLVNGVKIVPAYQAIVKNGLIWLSTSITILIVWWCTFYSAKTVGAVEFIFIYFIMRAIFGYSDRVFITKSNRLADAIPLLGLIGIIVFLYYSNVRSIESSLGFLAGCVGGATGYIYSKSSYQLSKKAGLSSTQILAVRFYILILVLLSFIDIAAVKNALMNHWLALGCISAVSFVIPVYFNQQGILKARPEGHAIITAFTPVFVVMLELILLRNEMRISQLVLAGIITVLISPQLVLRLFEEEKTQEFVQI